MSCPLPNVGPQSERQYIESLFELYIPVRGSLTGAHPGLFTSENKNALESYWYLPLEAIREKLKMEPSVIRVVCSDTHFRNSNHPSSALTLKTNLETNFPF